MISTYRYDCPLCKLQSDPYMRRSTADRIGHDHRTQRHDGLHPTEEGILVTPFELPTGKDLKVLAIVAAIILAGLVSKLL